jgi:colanic acid biosynthesis glycosyl transferase WcaI
LSRELARRGHDVLHLHFQSYPTGKGALERKSHDPQGFRVEGLAVSRTFKRYSLWRRPLHDRNYARAVVQALRDFGPDVVLSANTPLISQWIILSECARSNARFVFWQQDILSVGIKNIVKRRFPLIGDRMGDGFIALERLLLRRSDAIVTISEDFLPLLSEWALPPEKIHVIENWAPLGELPKLPRDNAWAREHGLSDMQVVLYSGTLGLKHNPQLLLELSTNLRLRDDVRVVVVSEGVGAEWLRDQARTVKAENLVLLGVQPYDRLPEVLATGDILVAVLEPDAGVFSVPSKVLSYLCAGRPLLASVPTANLAARIIGRSRSGIVVEPHDIEGFVAAAARLLDRPPLRAGFGLRARQYAEATFDIRRIGDRFERLFEELISLYNPSMAAYEPSERATWRAPRQS